MKEKKIYQLKTNTEEPEEVEAPMEEETTEEVSTDSAEEAEAKKKLQKLKLQKKPFYYPETPYCPQASTSAPE